MSKNEYHRRIKTFIDYEESNIDTDINNWLNEMENNHDFELVDIKFTTNVQKARDKKGFNVDTIYTNAMIIFDIKYTPTSTSLINDRKLISYAYTGKF